MQKIMTSGGSKKDPIPDAHAFVKFVTSNELKKYIGALKPKATKKKPLSFDRLSIIVMAVFKFLES